MAKLNNFSSAGIRSQANRPVRIYDDEGEALHISELQETKDYAAEILAILKKSGDWISGPELRRMTGTERIRFWDAAISLLCDDVETRGVTIPHYRAQKLRRMKMLNSSEGNSWAVRKRESNKLVPTAALGLE